MADNYDDLIAQHPDYPVTLILRDYHPSRHDLKVWVQWGEDQGMQWYPRPIEHVNSDTIVFFREVERDQALAFKLMFYP